MTRGGMSVCRWHEYPDVALCPEVASVSGGDMAIRRWHACPEVACVSGGGVRV